MSEKLRPCPFCGSTKICTEKSINLNYCDNCSAESNVEHWNTRPIEDALTVRIAELEAEQRWRVVADGELPELGKEVIFYDSIIERRLKGCLRKNGGVEWLSDEGYTFSSRDDRYSWITHWMPLPTPPEVQE